MNYCGKTDIGKKRKDNEDNFGDYLIGTNAALFVVCDGMGGAAGGAEASSLALDKFSEYVIRKTGKRITGDGALVFGNPETEVPELLGDACYNANFEVWQEAQDNPALHGMGTTMTGIFVILSPVLQVWSFNIGDSRTYRIRGDEIEQLTKDHSYIQYLVDNGAITVEEAEKRNDKNIITKAIGISVQAEPDIKKVDVLDGDMLVMCTDGLHGMLTNDEIHGVAVFEGASLPDKTEKLVSLANDAGGEDNITVLMVSF